jgi:hypothetical protein
MLAAQCRQRYRGIGALCENTSLVFPERAMETASPAFRADSIAAAIEVVIRRFFHQNIECHSASSGVHRFPSNLHKNIKKAPSLFCCAQCNNGAIFRVLA